MMKTLKPITLVATFAACALGVGLGTNVHASPLMLDFGQTNVAPSYQTLSPGHSVGGIPATETAWNRIAVTTPNSSLVNSDGTAATGVTLTLGQEAAAGNNTISYSTAIANLNLAGSGGAAPGQQNLLGAGSIYGDNTSSSAVGRDGIFGSGSAAAGNAMGLRLDGLSAGSYILYVMARNVNSDVASLPMNIFAGVGALAGTFNFASLTATPQSNIGYASATYAGQYTTFVNGENYVSINVSLAAGESLYLAVDGGSAAETRGFLNAVQIEAAPVPEPTTAVLFALSFGSLLVVIRKRRTI